ARRVAHQLGIDHHVFNFTDDFDRHVVEPYVEAWAGGRTPNPCIECNRHLKFDRFLQRAEQLGFDAIATGHHARVEPAGDRFVLRRGADPSKDQSYVLAMLTQTELARTLLPIGAMTKQAVRALAGQAGLRTAAKPDSQDVCFISRTGGRTAFLGSRIALHPGRVLDSRTGELVGTVPAIELVTPGQRRGLGGGASEPRYAIDVDVAERTVRVGPESELDATRVNLHTRTWTGEPLADGAQVLVQTSAHGAPTPAVIDCSGVQFLSPRRRVAEGQTVALYVDDEVVGSGIACSSKQPGLASI
ncbi:MAG: MnmA/TRMU family protein, partial [Acidimicrobiales bacterium]